MSTIPRDAFDNFVLVTRDGNTEATFDGKVKNLVYDVVGMAWIAQSSSTGGTGIADSTAANQLIEIIKLTSIDGKLGSLGQKTMSGSAPVVIASDQGAVPVSIASMPSTPVTAISLPLPTGAAQDSTVSTMSGKLPASLGQKAMAASLPVTLASDQGNVPVSGSVTVSNLPAIQPVSAAVLPLPTNAAQELGGTQATQNDILLLILQELQTHRLLLASAYGVDPMITGLENNIQ